MALKIVAKDQLLSKKYLNPEIMAIGDSIFNGVRSLSLSGQLAALSPIAQMADALKLKCTTPDYPRPVLVDLEEAFRGGLPDLIDLKAAAVKNAQAWIKELPTWSKHIAFDNIAIAGATYPDLLTTTAGEQRGKIHKALKNLKDAKGLSFYGKLFALYNAINTIFLLNPTGLPELDDLTPIDMVSHRKPKRLFINIGNNEGLFRIGVSGDYNEADKKLLRSIPTFATELAEHLVKDCGDVERIYFNLLIRPRVLANLAPRTDNEMYQTPENGGYFKTYVGRLTDKNEMTAKQMESFDNEVSKVNAATEANMKAVFGAQAHKLQFVNIFNISEQFDTKHWGDTRKVPVRRKAVTWQLSNYPFSSNIGGFRQGGLWGLDNMHPAAAGYALLAEEMRQVVVKTEDIANSLPILPQKAFDKDTLLQDVPRNWDALMLVFSAFANLGFFRM
jgi:lysophospholipase L1-like esterase|nr:SGNH/GDSL hydrolase family protein [uncultured Dongia sp.]